LKSLIFLGPSYFVYGVIRIECKAANHLSIAKLSPILPALAGRKIKAFHLEIRLDMLDNLQVNRS
jgi:hypothetical protein